MALRTPPSPWPIHPSPFKEEEQMSKRIVAQVARVIAVIGTLVLCGCTSDATWTESHYFSSADEFVPVFPDRLLSLADREVYDPQAP